MRFYCGNSTYIPNYVICPILPGIISVYFHVLCFYSFNKVTCLLCFGYCAPSAGIAREVHKLLANATKQTSLFKYKYIN